MNYMTLPERKTKCFCENGMVKVSHESLRDKFKGLTLTEGKKLLVEWVENGYCLPCEACGGEGSLPGRL